jgi:hypothetical protein
MNLFLHTYLAENEFPNTETGELLFNKNPEKLSEPWWGI